MKILIAGVNDPSHVGGILLDAARAKGIDAEIIDTRAAMAGPGILKSIVWRMAHRPLRLEQFSKGLVRAVAGNKPDILITTGNAPVNAESLRAIRMSQVRLVNYSTDDPWNPLSKSEWLFAALREYDTIFTPRTSNVEDLRRNGSADVRWLPFGYSPAMHFPEEQGNDAYSSDVAFIGGADADRVPLLAALIQNGFKASLWGGYWHRFAETKASANGLADTATLRKVLTNTRCALTLVRRLNRDGHVMRTFEVAAIGAPVLAEYTAEHESILGPDGEGALYFRNETELVQKVRWLVENPHEGREMGTRLRARILANNHAYTDRLEAMLAC